MSTRCPRLLRRWRRPHRLFLAPASNDAHGPRLVASDPAGHLDSAMSEVHAARVAMRNALLEFDRALSHGEEVDAAARRLIDTEISGTREEAAILTALLVTADREVARPAVRG